MEKTKFFYPKIFVILNYITYDEKHQSILNNVSNISWFYLNKNKHFICWWGNKVFFNMGFQSLNQVWYEFRNFLQNAFFSIEKLTL